MTQYLGTKLVVAEPMTRAEYNEFRGWALPENEDGTDEGYLVEYTDGGKPNVEGHVGYVSWSPKEQFDNAYRWVAALTFGQALEAIKTGQKVARVGWNGKSMWIGLHVESGKFTRDECGTELEYANYIVMKTVDNKLVPWLASQTDVLAEDWSIV